MIYCPALPVELLVEVFVQVCEWPEMTLYGASIIASERGQPSPFLEPNKTLVRVAAVCQQWRLAALSSPFLWTHIDLMQHQLAKLFILRTARHGQLDIVVPKAVHQVLNEEFDEALSLLAGCFDRLQSLSIHFEAISAFYRFLATIRPLRAKQLEVLDLILANHPHHERLPVDPEPLPDHVPLPVKSLKVNNNHLLSQNFASQNLKVLDLSDSDRPDWQWMQTDVVICFLMSTPNIEVLRVAQLTSEQSIRSTEVISVDLPLLKVFQCRFNSDIAYLAFELFIRHLKISPSHVTLDVPFDSTGFDAYVALRAYNAFQSIKHIAVFVASDVSIEASHSIPQYGDAIDTEKSSNASIGIDDYCEIPCSDISRATAVVRVLSAFELGTVEYLHWEHPPNLDYFLFPRPQWVQVITPFVGLTTFVYVGVEIDTIISVLTPGEGLTVPCPLLSSLKLLSTSRSREVGWSPDVTKATGECFIARQERGLVLEELVVNCSKRSMGSNAVKALERAIRSVVFGYQYKPR